MMHINKNTRKMRTSRRYLCKLQGQAHEEEGDNKDYYSNMGLSTRLISYMCLKVREHNS
nr:hypothetical protein Q903MT_gene6242 [Picea sitchensis]